MELWTIYLVIVHILAVIGLAAVVVFLAFWFGPDEKDMYA